MLQWVRRLAYEVDPTVAAKRPKVKAPPVAAPPRPDLSNSAAAIELLHRYNEVKDVAQRALGRIADRQGVSLADVYRERNLAHLLGAAA